MNQFPRAVLAMAMAMALVSAHAVDEPAEKPPDFTRYVPNPNPAVFTEVLTDAEYRARIEFARPLIDRLKASRANLPERGCLVIQVQPGGAAAKAGITVSCIMTEMLGVKINKRDDIANLPDKPSTMKWISPDGVEHSAEGIMRKDLKMAVEDFQRDNPSKLDVDHTDPRWSQEVELASYVGTDDPELSETALARAVKAGMPVSFQLKTVAPGLAMRAALYQQCMDLCVELIPKIKEIKGNPAQLYSFYFNAARSSGHYKEALEMAKKIPDSGRFIADLTAAEKRVAQGTEPRAELPGIAAKKMFHDDLLIRSELLPPGTEMARPAARALNAFCYDVSSTHVVENGRYYNTAFFPAAKNVHFTCRYRVRTEGKVEIVPKLTFDFFIADPKGEKTYEAQVKGRKEFGLLGMPHWDTNMVFNASRMGLQVVAHNASLFSAPEMEHRVDMYALNGWLEIDIDGRMRFLAPQFNLDAMRGMVIEFSGVKARLSHIAFCELLTPDERRAKVDPEINKAFAKGWTRLHRTVQWADHGAIAELLKLGAKVDAITADGLTPLMLAARCNQLETVKLLVKSGAKLDTLDKDGRSALVWANENFADACAEYLMIADPKLNQGGAVKPPRPPDNETF